MTEATVTKAEKMMTHDQRVRAQRRVVLTLAIATILGGLGIGAGFSAGSLLIVEVSENPALSGLAATMNAIGATLAGIPLAKLAMNRGRRVALSTGSLIAALGAFTVVFAASSSQAWLLFAGLTVLGIASAVQLQSRFSAADLAPPNQRARDLSLVVWSITVGAVVGPNLIGPGAEVSRWLGLPELSGVFVFTVVAQIAAALTVWLGLRPDPLLAARAFITVDADAQPSTNKKAGAHVLPVSAQWLVITAIAAAHAVMVALMAMTPLHITQHGGSITLVGITISLHIAGMYALSPIFGVLTGKFGAVTVMVSGFAVLVLSALGTAFGNNSHVTIQIALILLGVGWGMVTVSGAALLTEITPPAVRPKRQGQSDTVMNAAGATAGALSGVGFALGGFPLLSLLAGLIIVIGVVVVLRLAVLLRH